MEIPFLEDEDLLLEAYRKEIMKRHREELDGHAEEIDAFIAVADEKAIELDRDDFRYFEAVGIGAEKEALALSISGLTKDKEGSIPMDHLKQQFSTRSRIAGSFFAENFIILPHPFFRRGFYPQNNFHPNLLEKLWRFEDAEVELSMAVDADRVRLMSINLFIWKWILGMALHFRRKFRPFQMELAS